MKEYILPILILISVAIITLLLRIHIIPKGATSIIIPVSLVIITLVKKIHDNTFSKRDCLILSLGLTLTLIIIFLD